MKRLVFLGALAVAVGGGLRAPGQVGLTSVPILRSDLELHSLTKLLEDPEAWSTLDELSRRYAAWRIHTQVEPLDPGGGDGAPVVRHSFIFSDPRGLSSRACVVSFLSEAEEGGERRFTLLPATLLEHEWAAGDVPAVAASIHLRVLRAALEKPAVGERLALRFADHDVASITVSRQAAWQRSRRERVYSMTAVFRTRGERPQVDGQLVCWAVYDIELQKVVHVAFDPEEGG
jgi:hypothetical protein